MNAWLPHLERPWWLLLILPLAWLFWRLWRQRRRVGQWPLLLPLAFQPWLLVEGMPPRRRPWLLLAMAWMLAVLALSGPSWQRVSPLSKVQGEALVILLEMTPDLYASDLSPTRLAQVQRSVRDLIQARAGLPTALIAYAGSAHVVVPLSDDPLTTLNLLDALKPELMPVSGYRADLAVQQASQLLKQGAAGQGRLLLLTSHLSFEERQGIHSILAAHQVALDILGIGTPLGAPVPNEDGGFIREANGAIRLARLESSELADFAHQQHGRYWRLDEHYHLPPSVWGSREASQSQSLLREEIGHWLLLPLVLLAAFGARRGWLLALTLCFMPLPTPAYAVEWSDLWLRPDQQGMQLLNEQRPQEAAHLFLDHRWKGVALYQARDYAAAAQAFAQDDSAAGHYNRGNALALQGELEAALRAYNQALTLDPQFAAALHNRQRVEDALRQQFQEQQANETANAQSHETNNATTARNTTENEASTSPIEARTTLDHRSRPPTTGERSTQETSNTEATEPPPQGDANLNAEQQQALEQWLRQIPDDPAELLRHKFRQELHLSQEESP